MLVREGMRFTCPLHKQPISLPVCSHHCQSLVLEQGVWKLITGGEPHKSHSKFTIVTVWW